MTDVSNQLSTTRKLASPYHARQYFGSLNGIRAVAILGVLWHHTAPRYDSVPITQRGYLGVDLFFVLSGFLIVTLLLRENDRYNQIDLRSFYARRALRIFPLFYTVIFGVLVASVFMESDAVSSFRSEWLAHSTYTSNLVETTSILAISWSLATEEQFYLIWPPIQRFAGVLALPFLGLVIAISQLVNFGIIFSGKWAEGWELGDVTLTPICLGVLAAYALHYRFDVFGSLLSSRWVAPVLGATTIFVANLESDVDGIVGVHRLSIHLLMMLLVASVVVREDNGLAPILKLEPIARLGVISYGMYLLHVIVMAVINLALPWWAEQEESLLGFAIVLITTVGAAELSFKYFEKPILSQKTRFANESGLAASTSRQT